MATQAVLQTYELLEDILSYLPAKSLNNARLVQKSWNTVARRSPRTRQTLFLDAQPAYEVFGFHPNPGPACDDTKYPYIASASPERPKTYPIVTLHPRLDNWAWSNVHPRLGGKISISLESPDMMLALPAICRDQLVTQPPLPKINIRLESCTHPDADFFQDRIVANPEGVRIRDVLEALHQMRVVASEQLQVQEKWQRDDKGRLYRTRIAGEWLEMRTDGFVLTGNCRVEQAMRIQATLAASNMKPTATEVDVWAARSAQPGGEDMDDDDLMDSDE